MSLLRRLSFPSNLCHHHLQILNVLGDSRIPNKLQRNAMPILSHSYTTSSLSLLKTKLFTFNNPTKPLPSSFKTQNFVKTLFPLKSSSYTTNHSNRTPIVTPNSLKFRLRNGETLYGLFLLGFSPIFAEIAGLAGYDFVVVDMEHGPGGISQALSCLHALAAARTPAILRVPENCPTWAKKALDLGPQGIMFPMIDDPEAAKKAVSYCRFQPNGRRGSANKVIRTSSYGIDEGYFRNYEENLLIMCQIESVEGIKRAEEIAAVDGVDCIQTGPSDLSASMGYLRDPGNKEVRDMLRTLEMAVLGVGPKEGGVYLAGMATPFDGPNDLRRRGYHMVSGAVDIGLFRSAAVEDVKKFKTGLMKGSDDAAKGKDADEEYRIEREKGLSGCKKL